VGLVEAALRSFLSVANPAHTLPELGSFSSGGALVDIADRNALYDVSDSE
jgi:hypothetical protein